MRCRRSEAEFILFAGQGHSQPVEKLKSSFKDEHTAGWFERHTTDTVTIADGASMAGAVREYLSEHPALRFYVIISPCDLEKQFRGHTVYTGYSKGLSKSSALTAKRILKYGMWWEDGYEYRNPGKAVAQQDLIEDYFQKVIFLDIDGVLNIVDYPRPAEVIVDAFVRNLV